MILIFRIMNMYLQSFLKEWEYLHFHPEDFLRFPWKQLLGFENMAILSYDDPKLIEAVFEKAGELIFKYYENLCGLKGLEGFFPWR